MKLIDVAIGVLLAILVVIILKISLNLGDFDFGTGLVRCGVNHRVFHPCYVPSESAPYDAVIHTVL